MKKTEPVNVTLQAKKPEDLKAKIMEKHAEFTKVGIEDIEKKVTIQITPEFEVKGGSYSFDGDSLDESMEDLMANLPGELADGSSDYTLKATLTYNLNKEEMGLYKKKNKPSSAGRENTKFGTNDFSIF